MALLINVMCACIIKILLITDPKLLNVSIYDMLNLSIHCLHSFQVLRLMEPLLPNTNLHLLPSICYKTFIQDALIGHESWQCQTVKRSDCILITDMKLFKLGLCDAHQLYAICLRFESCNSE